MAYIEPSYFFDSFPDSKIPDSIYKWIKLPSFTFNFINTPEYQRMRDIKQLGPSASYVFPGGTHTRFEHCLGTGHLANHMITSLKSKQGGELEITEKDVLNVTLAGLLHDLGHAASSHQFERNVIQALDPTTTWTHEYQSCCLIDYLIDKYNIDIDKEDVEDIKRMILGQKPPTTLDRNYLFEIVSSELNSVDVDKFDYICRDAYNVGVKNIHFDPIAFIESARVLDHTLAFHSDRDYDAYGLFQARYQMFKGVYMERVNEAISHMISDALLAANSTYNFLDMIHNPEAYVTLTDCVFDYIVNSKKAELQRSKELLTRIKYRDIYTFGGEVLLDPETEKCIGCINAEQVAGYGIGLRPEDIIVSRCTINYGCKRHNPVDYIYFYNENVMQPFKIEKELTSLVLPAKFEECYIRIYAKQREKVEEARKAFARFWKEKGVEIDVAMPKKLAKGKRKEKFFNSIPGSKCKKKRIATV